MPPKRPRPAPADARYHVPNVERAVQILEFLTTMPDGAGVSDMAAGLKIPKNSAFRIATTLKNHDFLLMDPDSKRYRLGRRLLSLGWAVMGAGDLTGRAWEVLRHLRDLSGETALLGVIANDHGVVLEQAPSLQPIKFVIDIGTRFALHASAPAKAVLAAMSAAERRRIIAGLDFVRFTANTCPDRGTFERMVAETAERGWAFDNQEYHDGVSCIAAAVLNHRGEPVAGIWITGPSPRFEGSRLPSLSKLVVSASVELSRRLGWQPVDTQVVDERWRNVAPGRSAS